LTFYKTFLIISNMDIAGWNDVKEILENLKNLDNLADYIERMMREMEEEDDDTDFDEDPYHFVRKRKWIEGEEKPAGKGSSASNINTYPGIPGKCKPTFLAIIPNLKKLKPNPIFYPKLLLEFFDWVRGCDNFSERLVVVVSEAPPNPFRPLHLHALHFIEPEYPWIYELAIDSIVLYKALPSITRYSIYKFLKNDWKHKFSWYIKSKGGLNLFDGIRII